MEYTAFSRALSSADDSTILRLTKSTVAVTPFIAFNSSSSSRAQLAQHSPLIFSFSVVRAGAAGWQALITFTSSKLLQAEITFSSVCPSQSTITF